MGYNKVTYGNETIIDLSSDTVEASNLMAGETAHDRNGEPVVGAFTETQADWNETDSDSPAYIKNKPNIAAAVTDAHIVDLIYPVGSIYLTVDTSSPATLFGGTWERIKDKFLLSAGDTYSNTNTGGSASHTHTTGSHTLTSSESGMPGHGHGFTQPTVSGGGVTSGISGGGSTGGITGGSHSHAIHIRQDLKVNDGSGQRIGGASSYSSTLNAGEPIQNSTHSHDLPSHNHNLPAHSHTVSGGSVSNASGQSATSGHSHGDTGSSSNLPPYLVVNVWKRTA